MKSLQASPSESQALKNNQDDLLKSIRGKNFVRYMYGRLINTCATLESAFGIFSWISFTQYSEHSNKLNYNPYINLKIQLILTSWFQESIRVC